jgi:hypothetical protein
MDANIGIQEEEEDLIIEILVKKEKENDEIKSYLEKMFE